MTLAVSVPIPARVAVTWRWTASGGQGWDKGSAGQGAAGEDCHYCEGSDCQRFVHGERIGPRAWSREAGAWM